MATGMTLLSLQLAVQTAGVGHPEGARE